MKNNKKDRLNKSVMWNGVLHVYFDRLKIAAFTFKARLFSVFPVQLAPLNYEYLS